MAEADSCVACSKTVRPRQEALQCDGCDRWQHRTCNTGMSRTFYRQLVRGEKDLPQWLCLYCSVPETPSLDELNTGRLSEVEDFENISVEAYASIYRPTSVANLSESDIFSSSDSDISCQFPHGYILGMPGMSTNDSCHPTTSSCLVTDIEAERDSPIYRFPADFSFSIDQTCFPPSTPKLVNGTCVSN